MDKLSFSVDKFDLKEISDNQLMELEVWLVSEGDNAHKMPISLNAIQQAVPTLVGKPVLYKYCKHTKDFEEHESDEVACGVVLSDADMRFEIDESGKSWLVCKAYIWKYYYPDVVEVFQRDENKSVSMEISIIDSKDLQDGRVEIVSFVFLGLTLLGNAYRPAIPYAKASVLKFSEMVKETKTILNKTFGIPKEEWGSEDKVQIDLSKESANATGTWGDVDKTKLMHSILKCSNYKSLINSCYLVKENGWQNNPGECLKYPICNIENGKLVYSIDGVKTALSFLEKNTDSQHYKTAKSKLLQIFYKLDLGIENFVKKEDEEMKLDFNKTEEEVEKKEMADDSVEKKEEELEKKEDKVEKEEEKVEEKEEEKKEMSVDYEAKYNEMCSKYAELEEKFNASEEEKVKMSEKNQELQKFKSDIEDQENKAKIEFAIESVSKYFTQEQKDDWRNKVSEFKTIEEFSNAIKAFAFELNSGKDNFEKQDFTRIHIPKDGNENKDNKSLWDRI